MGNYACKQKGPLRRVIFGLGILAMGSTVQASSFFDDLIDPNDGWLDGGKFLLEYPYGVLPVPIIITEPAVGAGLGLAGVHFHDRDPAQSSDVDSKGRQAPRSISAVAAGATSNDTKFIGGAHFGHYKQDSIRYEGILGYADVYLDFFGTGDQSSDKAFSFNSEAVILNQALAFRLAKTDWFLGGAYRLLTMDARFDLNDGSDPGVDPDSLESSNAAVAAIIRYDSLDNTYVPKFGIVSDLQIARFDEDVGGDFNYNQYTLLNQVHFPLSKQWTLGLRMDLDMVDGDAPFYAIPYIELKGIPALRYQGDNIVTTEARVNWQFHPRWQLGAFLGAGRAANGANNIDDAPSRISQGVGFRYLGVKKLGLNMGLDFAAGPEENTVYISFGTRW